MNTVISMSLTASVVILFTLIARLILKKAPKVFSYALWLVVLFRLLCPVSPQSEISLFNIVDLDRGKFQDVSQNISESFTPVVPDNADIITPDQITPAIPDESIPDADSDITVNYQTIAPTININESPLPTTETVDKFLGGIWIIGLFAMVIYSVLSLNTVRIQLIGAIPVEKDIYIADHIQTPFVIGILNPKIYLPSHLGETEQQYIILHEKHHIKRYDHIIKILFFIALVIHWFNPLVWLAFILFTKDMEMSCDEAVMKQMGENIKADYSLSLLLLATGRKNFAPSPLAFGEGDTKERIINLSKWKRPTTVVITLAIVAIIIMGTMLITDPVETVDHVTGSNYETVKILYDEKYTHSDLIEEMYLSTLPMFQVTADKHLYIRDMTAEEMWTHVGKLERSELTTKDIKNYTYVDNAWVNKNNIKTITDCYIVRGEDAAFWHVFKTKNGKTYVAYGWEDVRERGQAGSDDTFLRYIYEVESTLEENNFDTAFFQRSLENTLNRNVDTFTMFRNLDEYVIIGFFADVEDKESYSDMSDMGYALFRSYKGEGGYDLLKCHLYANAAEENDGICLADAAVFSDDGTSTPANTYDVIIINNDSISKAVRILTMPDGTTKEIAYPVSGSGSELIVIRQDTEKNAVMISTVFYDKYDNQTGEVFTKAVRTENAEEPFGKMYVVAEVSYRAYDQWAEKISAADTFLLGNDYTLFVSDNTSPTGYKAAGRFEETKFAPATFDEYFKVEGGWVGFPYGPEWLRENKSKSWKLEDGNKFYYLITTESGGVYLTYGQSGNAYPEIDESAFMSYAVALTDIESASNDVITPGSYIYWAPHLSTTPDDMPEYVYTVRDGAFTLTRGDAIIVGGLEFGWQDFPWTEEEWKGMFIGNNSSVISLEEKYGEVKYQDISGRYFLLNVGEQIWVVDKPDKLISTVFILNESSSDGLAFMPGASAYQFTKYITGQDVNSTILEIHYEPSLTSCASLSEEELTELVGILNNIPEKDITEGTSRYRADLILYCNGREVLLRYDEKDRVSFGFDSATSALYGEKQWMTEDEALCEWFKKQIEFYGAKEPFINAETPHHMTKNLWKDFATTKTLTQKDADGNRLSTRDLKASEYNKLFNIIKDLPEDSFEKGTMKTEYLITLRADSWHAIYLGYSSDSGKILLSGEWETMQLFGGSDWLIDSSELRICIEGIIE